MRLLILLLLVSGCATAPSFQLVDQKNRSQSQRIVDDKQCSTYRDRAHNYFDEQYYYACMDLLGYKLEEVKSVNQ